MEGECFDSGIISMWSMGIAWSACWDCLLGCKKLVVSALGVIE